MIRKNISLLASLFLFTYSCSRQTETCIAITNKIYPALTIIPKIKHKGNLENLYLKFFDFNTGDCKLASDSAKKEADCGNYFYTISGTVYLDEFENFYIGYTKRKYNVIMKASCTGVHDCFSIAANYHTIKKYGEDFLERSRNEARALFKPKDSASSHADFLSKAKQHEKY